MIATVGSSPRWRRAASRSIVGVVVAMFASSGAHAGAPEPATDILAVLAGDGLHGYGRSLGTSLDALVEDGAVDSAAGAPPASGATQVDLLRFLAAGSTVAVIVQGAGYGPALVEVATGLPDEAFIWIPGDAPTDPATSPAGLPNVSTIYADVVPAATLLGEMLADGRLADVERLGWTGSSEPSGDDGIFITSLIGAAALDSGSVVLTSRLSQVPDESAPADSLAAEDSFDVLLVSGQVPAELPAPLRVEIAGPPTDDSESLGDLGDARRVVVGFHYEVALTEILSGYAAGELGGTEHHLTLENGGLTLFASDSDDSQIIFDALVDAGLAEPEDSVPPTSEDTGTDETGPVETQPPATSSPVNPTSPPPRTTTTTDAGTVPPGTGGPGTTDPSEPTTTPTTDAPTTTVAAPTTTDAPLPTEPPPTEPPFTLPTLPPVTTGG